MRHILIIFALVALLIVIPGRESGNADASPPRPVAAEKRIALTFDDAPRGPGAFLTKEDRAARLVAALRAAEVRQAAFFVNPGRIEPGDGDEAMIRAYVDAGHVIADHSFTHPHLSKVTAQAYLADIDKAQAWLKGRPGYRPWFRFPFLDEGGPDKAKRDAVRAGLDARGLVNGYVTAEGSDWNIEQLTIEAKRAGKAIDMGALRDLYVETHVEAADFADGLMRRTIGRAPAQVMLLHETDIAALYVADLVKALREAGWTIVTADEAYADPIRTARPDTPWTSGTLTEQMAWEKKLPAPRWYERNDLKIANPLFAERVLHEAAPAP
jgi:peptidoglycan-N-acetylglucosamine deacetylase